MKPWLVAPIRPRLVLVPACLASPWSIARNGRWSLPAARPMKRLP
jgi:hypothetical protein